MSSSPWDLHHPDNKTLINDSAEKAGANIAEFAIRSLATMVARNPPLYIEGTVPHLGSRLSVNSVAFGVILGCIVVVHGIVFALTYWLQLS